MLLFNTNWNCQQVAIGVNTNLQSNNHHQAINKLASSGETALITDGMPITVYQSGQHLSV